MKKNKNEGGEKNMQKKRKERRIGRRKYQGLKKYKQVPV